MDPKPGDHLIRLVEPVGVGRRKMRGQDPEWTLEFRMEDGHVLHVGLKSDASIDSLVSMLNRVQDRFRGSQPNVPAADPKEP